MNRILIIFFTVLSLILFANCKDKKKLNPDSSFVIATPTFVAGVRGTEFLVEDGEGNDQTLVSEGAVNIEILDENGNPTGKESVIEKGKKGVIENNLILNKDLSIEDLAELSEDSQSIASISEQARARMQEILQTVQDQKQINREIFEEQMQKNRTELNDLKDKNQQLLNDTKEENKQLLNENTEKAKQNKDEVKDNSKVQTDEIKDKGSSEIDEMKNKNKIDKSQVAPK